MMATNAMEYWDVIRVLSLPCQTLRSILYEALVNKLFLLATIVLCQTDTVAAFDPFTLLGVLISCNCRRTGHSCQCFTIGSLLLNVRGSVEFVYQQHSAVKVEQL